MKIYSKSLTYISSCNIITNVVIEPTTEYRGIAKLVRHWILNPAFVGSSPATPASGYYRLPSGDGFLILKMLAMYLGNCIKFV